MTHQNTTEDIEADDELITAYLDYELKPVERSVVDRRLIDDEGFRNRLAQMRRAWELLDELPETPLNQHFTKSTLEMVAVDLEKIRTNVLTIEGWKLPWVPKISRKFVMFSAAVLAIIVGGAIGGVLRNRSVASEARQLVVAGALPVLQDFPEIGMLQELAEIPRWKDLLEMPSLREHMLPATPASDDVNSIKEWASRTMDVHQKELLYDQKQALDRMQPEARSIIEARYKALRSHPDADELQQVGIAMNSILQSLRMKQRANIRSLPNDRKTIAIRQEACLVLALTHGEKLNNDEKSHLEKWASVDLFRYLQESPSNPFPFQESQWQNLLYWKLSSSGATSQFNLDAINNDLDELLESFYEGLRPDTKQLFEGVAPSSHLLVIATWVLQKRPDVIKEQSTEELYDVYKNLPEDKKEQIDMQRPEEARRDIEFSERHKRRGMPGRSNGGQGPNGGQAPGAFNGPGAFNSPGQGNKENPNRQDRPPAPRSGQPEPSLIKMFQRPI